MGEGERARCAFGALRDFGDLPLERTAGLNDCALLRLGPPGVVIFLGD